MKTFFLLAIFFTFSNAYSQNKMNEKKLSDSLREILTLKKERGFDRNSKFYTLDNPKDLAERNKLDTLINDENFVLDLHELTGKIISNYLSDVSDLSLSKSYAVLDNSEGKLFLGSTFNLGSTFKGQENNSFVTVGVKSNVKEGFSNYFGENKLNNDIGISLKYIIKSGGTLYHNSKNNKNVNEDQYKQILNSRKKLFLEKMSQLDSDVTKFKKNYLLEYPDDYNLKDTLVNKKEFVNSKIIEKGGEFIKDEVEYIAKNKIYNQISFWWFSMEGYIPVTPSVYKTSKDIFSKENQQKFSPYSFSFSANRWWSIPKTKDVETKYFINRIFKGNYLISIKADLVYNNSILTNQITTLNFDEFQTYLPQMNNTYYLVKTNSNEMYVGDYKEFITPKLLLKFVYIYPFENLNVGARFSIEKSFGYSSFLNWKIGVPFSFKDKDGNTKINFEIVKQNVMNINSIGINIGLPLQKF